MIEKYIKGIITRTDMEDWIITHSLMDEYQKPYSGQPFGINKETGYQVVDEIELNQIKKDLEQIKKK